MYVVYEHVCMCMYVCHSMCMYVQCVSSPGLLKKYILRWFVVCFNFERLSNSSIGTIQSEDSRFKCDVEVKIEIWMWKSMRKGIQAVCVYCCGIV